MRKRVSLLLVVVASWFTATVASASETTSVDFGICRQFLLKADWNQMSETSSSPKVVTSSTPPTFSLVPGAIGTLVDNVHCLEAQQEIRWSRIRTAKGNVDENNTNNNNKNSSIVYFYADTTTATTTTADIDQRKSSSMQKQHVLLKSYEFVEAMSQGAASIVFAESVQVTPSSDGVLGLLTSSPASTKSMKGRIRRAAEDFITIYSTLENIGRVQVMLQHQEKKVVDTSTKGGMTAGDASSLYSAAVPLQTLDFEGGEAMRRFQEQAVRRNIVNQTHQQVGDSKQFTMVFLAAGYKSTEKAIFESDVTRAMVGLRKGGGSTSTTKWSAEPWSRYFHLMNFYSIFEPSTDSGASVAVKGTSGCTTNSTGAGDTDGTGSAVAAPSTASCSATTKNNNLDCSYGSPEFHRLACSSTKMLSLASNSYKADVVVALVNDQYYGGTGYRTSTGQGLLTVYNGADMEKLLVHELGHAAIGLADEYSYGFSEDKDISLPNCQKQGVSERVKWDAWISTGKVDNPASALGCSFNNYLRPTKDSCMMRSIDHQELCAVCKEKTVTTMFNGDMRLDTPRCPPLGYEIYLTGSEQATLTMNHHFATLNQNVSLVWDLPGGEPITGIPAIVYRGAQMTSPSSVIVRANLTDSTDMVFPVVPDVEAGGKVTNAWPRLVSSEFMFRRDDANKPKDCKPMTCTSTNNQVHTYSCARCVKAGGCTNVPTLLTPYDDTGSQAVSIEQAESITIGVACLLCIGGILVIGLSVAYVVYMRKTQPQEVLVIEGSDSAAQGLCGFFAGVVFILAIIFMILNVVYLPKVSVFGFQWVIAGLVFTAFVYIGSVSVIMGAVARKEGLLLVGGPLFIGIMSIATVALACAGIYIVNNSNTASLIEQYRVSWLDNAQNRPQRMCVLQKFLGCSGFDYACVPTASSYCPANCDDGNLNPNACLTVWQEYVSNTIYPLTVLASVAAFCMLLTVLCTVIFYLKLHRLRATARGRRSYRRDDRAPVAAATKAEIVQLKEEFVKADDDDNGKLDSEEVIQFLQATLGESTSADDELLLVQAAKDGDLDFEKVLQLYFPMFSRSQDPRILTQEEAEEAEDSADLQRLQYRKHQDFMAAAGCLSPEQLIDLHEKHTSLGAATEVDFFDVLASNARQEEDTDQALLCEGLSPHELEGLRCSWAALHPEIRGPLADEEIDKLFQWTHGQAFVSQEHFLRWRQLLDVRNTGKIGWPEFCFPFAKRSKLKKARRELEACGRECDSEMKGYDEVEIEFGEDVAQEVFSNKFETQVPSERILAHSLRPTRGEEDD